jgi:hypothetical protein
MTTYDPEDQAERQRPPMSSSVVRLSQELLLVCDDLREWVR